MTRYRMSAKDKFDGCLQIANFAVGRVDVRRQFEWKLSFGVWALLGAALIYVRADAFPALIGVAILGLYAVHLHAHLSRNYYDINLAWDAVREANSLLELGLNMRVPAFVERPEEQSSFRRYFSFLTNWATGLQFWFTAGLIMLFYAVKVKTFTLWWLSATIAK